MDTTNNKKRVQFNLAQRKIILDYLSNGESCRKLAKKFGVSPNAIFKINKNRTRILEALQNNSDPNRKRLSMGQNDTLNEKMFQFFRVCRAKGIPVNGPILQETAKEMARDLNLNNFSASNGWLESFRKRHNVQFRHKTEDTSGSSLECKTVAEWKAKIPDIISQYKVEDIFNADETAVSYLQIHTKYNGENTNSCNGIKISKERITVLFCCNAIGEKLKPLVIGKVAYPKVFKAYHIRTEDLPIIWRHNKKAWMTSVIFTEWLKLINSEMRATDRKILLFIDNASSHFYVDLSHVKIAFLPPNLASAVPPLNQGILHAIKLSYGKKMLRALIHSLNSSENVSQSGSNISLIDAIEWINDAWQSLPLNTIVRCFAHAGFPINDVEDLFEDESERSEHDLFIEQLESIGMKDFDMVLSLDDNCQVHEDAVNTAELVYNQIMNVESVSDEDDFLKRIKDEDSTEPIVPLETVLEYCMEVRKYAYATNNQEMVQLLYELKRKVEDVLWDKQIKSKD